MSVLFAPWKMTLQNRCKIRDKTKCRLKRYHCPNSVSPWLSVAYEPGGHSSTPRVRTQAQAAGWVGRPSAEPGAPRQGWGGTLPGGGGWPAARPAHGRTDGRGPCQAIRKQARQQQPGGLQVHASEDPQVRPAQGRFHRPLPPPWTPAWPGVQPTVEASGRAARSLGRPAQPGVTGGIRGPRGRSRSAQTRSWTAGADGVGSRVRGRLRPVTRQPHAALLGP